MELPRKQNIAKDHILNLIRNGMRQGDLLPSISELSATLSLSQMTVNRAMESLAQLDVIYKVPGKGTFVGSKDRIKKTLPRFRHALLPPGQRPIITFLSPFLHNDPFMVDFTRGVVDAVDHDKYSLINRHVWISKMKEEQILMEAAMQSSGLIVISSYPPAMRQLIHELVRRNYPLVMLDNWPPELHCNAVSADNEDAVNTGMEYLYGMGHRKIIYAADSGHDDNSARRSRVHAYERFMLRKSLPPSVVTGEAPLLQLFDRRRNECPTAIFAVCDSYAMRIYEMLKTKGFRLPEDVSLIGIDGDCRGNDFELPLTTLMQPKYKIGTKAVDILEKIMTESRDVFSHYYIPCELIIRKSVASVTTGVKK